MLMHADWDEKNVKLAEITCLSSGKVLLCNKVFMSDEAALVNLVSRTRCSLICFKAALLFIKIFSGNTSINHEETFHRIDPNTIWFHCLKDKSLIKLKCKNVSGQVVSHKKWKFNEYFII